jgi:glutathione S-transferase
MARQAAIAKRALDRLEADAATLDDTLDLGNLSIAIALDYLDFRFPGDAWREGRPKLAAWHERYSKRESLKATMPK